MLHPCPTHAASAHESGGGVAATVGVAPGSIVHPGDDPARVVAGCQQDLALRHAHSGICGSRTGGWCKHAGLTCTAVPTRGSAQSPRTARQAEFAQASVHSSQPPGRTNGSGRRSRRRRGRSHIWARTGRRAGRRAGAGHRRRAGRARHRSRAGAGGRPGRRRVGARAAQAVLPAEAVAIAAHTLQFVRQEAVRTWCKCSWWHTAHCRAQSIVLRWPQHPPSSNPSMRQAAQM